MANQKGNFYVCAKRDNKSAVKHSIEKPILLNFVNLSTIFVSLVTEVYCNVLILRWEVSRKRLIFKGTYTKKGIARTQLPAPPRLENLVFKK